jgi:hypothetical protein
MTEQQPTLTKEIQEAQSEHSAESKRISRRFLSWALPGLATVIVGGLGTSSLQDSINPHADTDAVIAYKQLNEEHQRARHSLSILERQADDEFITPPYVPENLAEQAQELATTNSRQKAVLTELVAGYNDVVNEKKACLERLEATPEYQAYASANFKTTVTGYALAALGLGIIFLSGARKTLAEKRLDSAWPDKVIDLLKKHNAAQEPQEPAE